MKLKDWNSLQASKEGKKSQTSIGNISELNRITNKEVGKRLNEKKALKLVQKLFKNFDKNKHTFYYDLIRAL